MPHLPPRRYGAAVVDAREGGDTDVAAFEVHGARIGVRGSDAVACALLGEALAAALPHGARTLSGEDLDAVCTLRSALGRESSLHLSIDGEIVRALTDPAELAVELGAALDFAVAQHATERVFLHAGVVAWQGVAIVIPGRSLTGKTTLVSALVRAGATLYSDEFAPIDQHGRVWPHDRPLSVRAPGSTGRGRPVSSQELGIERGTEPVPVGLVVHTRHVPGATWRPVELDEAEGLLPLLDNAVVATTDPRRAMSFLAPVTAGARVLGGPRGDADEAAAQILQLLGRTGGDASAIVAIEAPDDRRAGALRHLLIRWILAVRHAAAARPETEARSTPTLALAPIGRNPNDTGLRWSQLFDLPSLSESLGTTVVDLDLVATDPAREWRRLDLLPPTTDPPLPPLGSSASWASVQMVEASCGIDAAALAEVLIAPPSSPNPDLFVTGAEQLGWGGAFDSLAFWSVVAATEPAAAIVARSEAGRPDGPYLGVHWRRADYAAAHPELAPSPSVAAEQIAAIAVAHDLPSVVVSTDATTGEVIELGTGLQRLAPWLEVDIFRGAAAGDLAGLERQAVEQEILVQSTWFVGTRGSASTAAVRERRTAIDRWTPEATWTVLCGDAHHPPDLDDDEHGPISTVGIRGL
jgi:hypothetical protein